LVGTKFIEKVEQMDTQPQFEDSQTPSDTASTVSREASTSNVLLSRTDITRLREFFMLLDFWDQQNNSDRKR
jgi:hypothetical protein